MSNRFVPLALTLLAPVLVNIVAFHALLAHGEAIALPLSLTALEIYLAWSYREAFAPMLRARVDTAHSTTAAFARTNVGDVAPRTHA